MRSLSNVPFPFLCGFLGLYIRTNPFFSSCYYGHLLPLKASFVCIFKIFFLLNIILLAQWLAITNCLELSKAIY